jgi:hypothetical protein
MGHYRMTMTTEKYIRSYYMYIFLPIGLGFLFLCIYIYISFFFARNRISYICSLQNKKIYNRCLMIILNGWVSLSIISAFGCIERKEEKKAEKFDLYCYDIFAIFLPFTMIDTQTHRQEYLLSEDLVLCIHMDNRRKREKN